jgi:hypothetical protein
VHVGPLDRERLRRLGVVVALCPRSNAILQSGTPPVAAYLREGSTVALGTDSLASSPSLNLLDEARRPRRRGRAGADDVDLAARLLQAATAGGAAARTSRHRSLVPGARRPRRRRCLRPWQDRGCGGGGARAARCCRTATTRRRRPLRPGDRHRLAGVVLAR